MSKQRYIAPDLRTRIEDLDTLPDLYSTKFRYIQKLNSSRIFYNFTKIRKNKDLLTKEDEEEEKRSLRNELKCINFNDLRKQKRFIPQGPFSRKRTTWDMCLQEVKYRAHGFVMDSKQRAAESFNLSKKARKNFIKRENQKRGNLNYHKLLSLELSHMVREEFEIVKRNMRVNDPNLEKAKKNDQKPDNELQDLDNDLERDRRITQMEQDGVSFKDKGSMIDPSSFLTLVSKSSMKEGLRGRMKRIIGQGYKRRSSDYSIRHKKVMQNYLKEIHKLLSKWNKQTIKKFLNESHLFDFIDKAQKSDNSSAKNELVAQNEGAQGANQSIIRVKYNNPMKKKLNNGYFKNILLENEKKDKTDTMNFKEQLEEYRYSKLSKCDNSQEVLLSSINTLDFNESYKELFKMSISSFDNFPKSLEEIPAIVFNYEAEAKKLYDNPNYFGGFYEQQLAENGIKYTTQQTLDKAEQLKLNFICTESLLRDNHFEPMINGLQNNKMAIFEQYESKLSIDTLAHIISPDSPDFFADIPDSLIESNILLYYIYRYESYFNKKWIWIEESLKNIPILKVYKIDLKKILKLWIYIQLLQGNNFIDNAAQITPFTRKTNFRYMPKVKKFGMKEETVQDDGYRQHVDRSMETLNTEYRNFCENIERRKKKLNFQFVDGAQERTKNVFFNKLKFHAKDKPSRKRFKPKRISRNGYNEQPKIEKLELASPSDIPSQNKKKVTKFMNYPKYLKKLFRQEIDRNSIVVSIKRYKNSLREDKRKSARRR